MRTRKSTKSKIAALALAAVTGITSVTTGVSVGSFSASAASATANQPGLNADGYYAIYTAAQLDWFSNQAQTDYTISAILMDDIVYNDDVLDENLELNDGIYTEWTPINYLSGNFDGNGHTIYGLYCNVSYDGSAGFIGTLNGGTVSDLTLEDCYFAKSLTQGQCLGGITNALIMGTIDGCQVVDSAIVDTYGTRSASTIYTAGIAGYAFRWGTITDCHNVNTLVSGSMNAAGIIGYVSSNLGGNTAYGGDVCTVIENCSNSGTIEGIQYAGGIIASSPYLAWATLKNCYNVGYVGCVNNDPYASGYGGIVGFIGYMLSYANQGTLTTYTSCYTSGTIYGTSGTSKLVGTYSLSDATGTTSSDVEALFTDCYYLADEDNGSAKTAEQFESGEVCWLMQQNNDDLVWTQEIGVEENPVLNGTDDTRVYRIAWDAQWEDDTTSSEDEMYAYTYSNEQVEEAIELEEGYTYSFYYEYTDRTSTKTYEIEEFPWLSLNADASDDDTVTIYIYRARNIELDDSLFTEITDENGNTYNGVAFTGTVGTPFEADLTDYIADLDEVGTLTFTSDSLPEGLELDEATGVVSGTPTKAYADGLVTLVSVESEDGASAEFYVVYTIAQKDISGGVTVDDDIANGTYYEGDAVPVATDTIHVVDENGDPISGTVEWTNVDEDGTLAAGDNELDYTFTPDDENLAPVSGTVTITALPVVQVATDITTIEGAYGEPLTEDVSDYVTNANDVGGVTYSSDNLPEGLEISSKGVISGTPTAVYPDGYEATVIATAGNGDTAEIPLTFVISLAEVEVEVADPDATYYEGDETPDANDVLTADIDGTFEWVDADDTLGLGDNELTWKFTPDDTENYGVSTGTVTLTAEAKVSVATYTTTLIAEYGEEVSKDMSEYVFNADEVGGVTYSSSTLPTGLTLDAATGLISGVPTALYTDGLEVTITVTAGNGSVDTISMTAIITKADPTDSITVNTEVTDDTVYYEGDAVPDVDDVLSSDIPGTFEWTTDKDTLDAGENELGWKFTPDDTDHYETVTGTVTIDAEELVTTTEEVTTTTEEETTTTEVTTTTTTADSSTTTETDETESTTEATTTIEEMTTIEVTTTATAEKATTAGPSTTTETDETEGTSEGTTITTAETTVTEDATTVTTEEVTTAGPTTTSTEATTTTEEVTTTIEEVTTTTEEITTAGATTESTTEEVTTTTEEATTTTDVQSHAEQEVTTAGVTTTEAEEVTTDVQSHAEQSTTETTETTTESTTESTTTTEGTTTTDVEEVEPLDKGDVDVDGDVDLTDAYLILNYYASQQVGMDVTFNDDEALNARIVEEVADIDSDGTVTLNDAYLALCYYAYRQVGMDVTWENLLTGHVGN